MTTAERYNEKLANEINRIYDATRELTFSKNMSAEIVGGWRIQQDAGKSQLISQPHTNTVNGGVKRPTYLDTLIVKNIQIKTKYHANTQTKPYRYHLNAPSVQPRRRRTETGQTYHRTSDRVSNDYLCASL